MLLVLPSCRIAESSGRADQTCGEARNERPALKLTSASESEIRFLSYDPDWPINRTVSAARTSPFTRMVMTSRARARLFAYRLFGGITEAKLLSTSRMNQSSGFERKAWKHVAEDAHERALHELGVDRL